MANASRAWRTAKSEGLKSTIWRSARYFADRYNPFRAPAASSVFTQDVIAVDWTKPVDFNSSSLVAPASGYKIAWVISPPGRTSGGHQNAFRFMSFLEQAGHDLTIYLYSPHKLPVVSIEEVTQMLKETSAYPDMSAEFRVYSPEEGIQGDFDAVFAADWQTAYAVHRHEGHAKRFYFAQDFEPAFYPWGSDFVLAENTYKLGFHGISAGRWLAKKLISDYGMSCDFYDYAVDKDHYRHVNSQPRNEVLFYARPPTPRRATEFGLLVLTELKRLRPDVVVNIVGWDMSGFEIPFEYVNHKALDISQLNEIYNRSAAGLVLSLTNMSLLPMEIMSSGVVPVVNDSPNTRGVFDSEYIEFVPMSPRAMAEKMIEIIDRPDAVEHSKVIARSVLETNWTDPGSDFIQKFEKAMTEPIPQPKQSR